LLSQHSLCVTFINFSIYIKLYIHYTTCLENLEMSGNLTAVREMSGILLKMREMSGEKTFSGKSCLRVFIVNSIFASIQVFNTSMGMIWVTINMLSATEECCEPSGISHCLESGHPVHVCAWLFIHIRYCVNFHKCFELQY